MFFSDSRRQFFSPLTGKYREWVAECLSLLYQRLYTDLRDYGNALSREQLVDIFKEAIARHRFMANHRRAIRQQASLDFMVDIENT